MWPPFKIITYYPIFAQHITTKGADTFVSPVAVDDTISVHLHKCLSIYVISSLAKNFIVFHTPLLFWGYILISSFTSIHHDVSQNFSAFIRIPSFVNEVFVECASVPYCWLGITLDCKVSLKMLISSSESLNDFNRILVRQNTYTKTLLHSSTKLAFL